MRCPAMVSYCMTTRTCEFLGCSPSPLWGAMRQGGGQGEAEEGGSHLL